MKFNIANPATGQQKLIDIEDERKVCVSVFLAWMSRNGGMSSGQGMKQGGVVGGWRRQAGLGRQCGSEEV